MTPFKFCTLCLCLFAAYSVAISQAKNLDAVYDTGVKNYDSPQINKENISPVGLANYIMKQLFRQATKLWPIIKDNIKSFKYRFSRPRSPKHSGGSNHKHAPKHEHSPKNENHPKNEKTPKEEEHLRDTQHTKEAENSKNTKSTDHKNTQKNEEHPKDKKSDKESTSDKDSATKPNVEGHMTTIKPSSDEKDIVDQYLNNQNQDNDDDDETNSIENSNPTLEEKNLTPFKKSTDNPNDSAKIAFIKNYRFMNKKDSPGEKNFDFKNFIDDQNLLVEKTSSIENDFSIKSPSDNLLNNLIYSINNDDLNRANSLASDNSLPFIPSESVGRQKSWENTVFMNGQLENSWDNSGIMKGESNNRLIYPIVNHLPQEFEEESYDQFNLNFNRF